MIEVRLEGCIYEHKFGYSELYDISKEVKMKNKLGGD